MKGHIRTNQKCPKCKGKFQKVEKGFSCPKCLTSPDRVFIDLHIQGERLKIYKDDSGQVLDSYERAERLLVHARWEIDNHQFKVEKYRNTKHDSFHFQTYTESWLREQKIRHKANDISYSTLYKNGMVVKNYLVPYFGMMDIRKIDTRNIKDFNLYLAELTIKNGKVMSAKYREYIIGLLRQIFYDGLRSGDLNRAQVPAFPTINTPDPYFDFLTEDEQDGILSKIPDHDLPLFHMIIVYGIRPSEVRALKRDCIIGEFNQIVIRRTFSRNNILRDNPKENKWRAISILDETKQILEALPISLTGFVFVNKWGRSYSQDYVNKAWSRACDDAGFRYIQLKNASRHSLGTKLAMEGYGEDMIAKVLGHSDTKTTKHYVRYASDALKPFYKRRNVKKVTVRKLSVETG